MIAWQENLRTRILEDERLEALMSRTLVRCLEELCAACSVWAPHAPEPAYSSAFGQPQLEWESLAPRYCRLTIWVQPSGCAVVQRVSGRYRESMEDFGTEDLGRFLKEHFG